MSNKLLRLGDEMCRLIQGHKKNRQIDLTRGSLGGLCRDRQCVQPTIAVSTSPEANKIFVPFSAGS